MRGYDRRFLEKMWDCCDFHRWYGEEPGPVTQLLDHIDPAAY